MGPNPKDFDPRRCNRCGGKADLGMTCSGPRCRACGCDRPRGRGRFAEEHAEYVDRESIWGPLHVEPGEETRRLWGPLTPAAHGGGRDEWDGR